MKMPWFKFHPSEYMSGAIMFCSDATQGVFVRIMCLCWQRGELPRDPDRLSRLIGTSSGSLETAMAELDRHGIIQDTAAGNFTIRFMAEQVEQARKEHESRVRGGRMTARKLWGNKQ